MRLGRASAFFVCIVATSTASAQEEPSATTAALKTLKEEIEVRKALAELRKAEAEASAAAVKAQFGDLAGYANPGTTTAAAGAGQIEAAILSNVSTVQISTQVVADVCMQAAAICKPIASDGERQVATSYPALSGSLADCSATGSAESGGTVKLYVVTEAEKPSFDTLDAVSASLCGLQRGLDRAIEANPVDGRSLLPAMTPAGMFTALSVVGNLLRSEYSLQGISLTPDDALFAKNVVTASRSRLAVPVVMPGIYRQSGFEAGNPLFALVKKIDGRRTEALRLATEHGRASKDAVKKKDPVSVENAARHSSAKDELEAAVKRYDDYFAKIATTSDKGISELGQAARDARMRADLAAGSYLLAVKLNAAGGTTYTKKNFWTFLGGVPFYASGGAVASYVLIAGPSGEIAGSGSYGVAGGFKKLSTIHSNSNVQ